MDKIKEILIGTNNVGKYKEICDLLPKTVKKYSLKEFKISSPEETGNSFKENSFIKASYFSKKTNLMLRVFCKKQGFNYDDVCERLERLGKDV